MKTSFQKAKNGAMVLLLFLIVAFALIAIYFKSPYGKDDTKIITPNVVKFLTTDGDTAYIYNSGHVQIYVHKK